MQLASKTTEHSSQTSCDWNRVSVTVERLSNSWPSWHGYHLSKSPVRLVSVRNFSTTPPSPGTPNDDRNTDTNTDDKTDTNADTDDKSSCDTTHETPPTTIPYEAPFASLALRLKRVSISSAVLSLFGVPFLIFMNGGGSGIPASGQLAVGGTAVLAATGSTAALSFCFSPYVHSLEWITIRCPSCVTGATDGGDGAEGGDGEIEPVGAEVEENRLVKAKTRNIFALPVETIFDPRTDVVFEGVAKKTNRPFCNFIAKGVPLYVHPELIKDEELRSLLLGGGGPAKGGAVGDQKKKGEDEDFL